MKIFYVTNLNMAPNEGILKKVKAQAAAMSSDKNICRLFIRDKESGNMCVHSFRDENESVEVSGAGGDTISEAIGRMDTERPDVLYVRLMIPSVKLCRLIGKAKKLGAVVYYEIPTYPYWGEQFKAAKIKLKAIVKIALDIIYAYPIYTMIDHLVIVRSNSRKKTFSKMVEIINGVDVSRIVPKNYDNYEEDGVIRFVGVGTIFPYHGYDKFFYALAACGEKYGDKVLETHIVGNSDTIESLKRLAAELKLQHVVFDGIKTTEELNLMYENFDIGLGCLALYRRNADIDTTLKIVEYYCRGVPVVTSGRTALERVDGKSCTITVANDKSKIDVNEICRAYLAMDREMLPQIAKTAAEIYDWKVIMTDLIKK